MDTNDFKSFPVGHVIRLGIFEFKKVNLSYWKMSASASCTSRDVETVLHLLQYEKSDLSILNLLDRGRQMPPAPERTPSHV